MHRRLVPLLLAAALLTTPGCSPDSGGQDPIGTEGSTGMRDPGLAAGPERAGTGGAPGGVGDDRSGGAASEAPAAGSGGRSGGDGSEVAPDEGPAATSLGALLDDAPAAGRLAGTPGDGHAVGRLVDTFPDDVLLVPDDVEVAASSVAGAGRHVHVSLDATTSRPCGDVLLTQRSWLTSGGFEETATDGVPDGSGTGTTLGFTRGRESVSLHLEPQVDGDGARCDLVVHGTLVAPGRGAAG